MNIEALREERQALQARIDYCPPENASNTRLDIAIRAGDKASDRLDDLAPTFALLDAIDELAARLDTISKIMMVQLSYAMKCGCDFSRDECGECAHFHTCRQAAEFTDMLHATRPMN